MTNKQELNLLIPENLPEYYVSGGAIASNSLNVRLILFNEELEKNNEIIKNPTIELIKTAKTEIIMHPHVAKQIRDLLDKELKKFDTKD